MNERYLFRGKRLDNGEWQYGLIVCGGMCGTAWIMRGSWVISESTIEERVFEVDPATVGQCTGIHAAKSYRGDRPEDRLVFEGDIIQRKRECDDKPLTFVVRWYEKYARFAPHDIRSHGDVFSVFPFDQSEIIGNVTDNPELLNEGRGKP